VCDLAAEDALDIINAEGAPVTLINNYREYQLTGTYSDIGSLMNPITGEPVQGRAIEVTVPALETINKIGIPSRGWKARLTGIDGKELTLFIQRNEPDRTLGVYRLTLGLTLQDAENNE
jgi:hypothetical protein